MRKTAKTDKRERYNRFTLEEQIKLHELAKQGDREAESLLVQCHWGTATGILRGYQKSVIQKGFLCADELESHAYEALLRAVRKWAPERASLTTMVVHCVRFELKTFLKRYWNKKRQFQQECQGLTDNIFDPLKREETDVRERVWDAVNKLNEVDRAVIYRLFYKSRDEMDSLAVSKHRSAAHQRMKRIARRLIPIMEKELEYVRD